MASSDILIVGGGLVGASLALALQAGAAQRGWRLHLVEPVEPGGAFQPSYDARASALSYGTRQLYERLGLWASIARRAEPIRRIHVSERGRFAATRLDAADEGVPALGYVVENAWIGQCLWQALDRDVVHLHCPGEVTAVAAGNDGYRLTLADGGVLEGGLVVLADGCRSGLREQLGIAVERRGYGQSALIANVTPGRPHRGEAFERFTEEGPLALLPLAEDRCALVWTRQDERIAALAELPDKAFLDALQEAFGYRLGAFRQVGARHVYPLALVRVQEQVRRGLVVLGNAAHSLHPIAGQGYNLSLRDALALADTLLASEAAPGDPATLQRYYRLQQPDQALTVGFSDRLVRLFGHRSRLLGLGRELGLAALDLAPPAKHHFARQAMGLGLRGHSDALS